MFLFVILYSFLYIFYFVKYWCVISSERGQERGLDVGQRWTRYRDRLQVVALFKNCNWNDDSFAEVKNLIPNMKTNANLVTIVNMLNEMMEKINWY